ncbi:MAG: hypothetical protein KBA81_06760 [Rhabdochlamydiaceae bacterium]|nr:hypothetical protein [Rhabdochlamydiaceae bacterium]
MKSERLRKLEAELQDLDQWLKLGLVPKKDLEKHRTEIISLKEKIQEEKERLRFLKESGAMEEYAPPKRPAHGRPAFPDTASMPDIEMPEEGLTDFGLEVESESYEFESTTGDETESGSESGSSAEEEAGDAEDEDEEDPFSDRNRWKRGVLEDPDTDSW